METREQLKLFLSELLKNSKNWQSFSAKIRTTKQIKEKLKIEANKIASNCKLAEAAYCILNDLTERPKCKECGAEVKWTPFANFSKFCSVACSNKNSETKEIKKKSYLEKYGVEYPGQIEAGKEKSRNTRRGKKASKIIVEQIPCKRGIEKQKETNLKKYGVECYFQSEDYKIKMQERYGVTNVSQLDYVKKKVKQTNLKRYGSTCYLQSEKFKEIHQKYNLDKYGVNYYFQSEKFKEIHQKYNLDKYGVNYYFQSLDFKKKSRKTNLEKYGTEIYTQSPDYKKKSKETFQRLYGVDNPGQIAKNNKAFTSNSWKKFKFPSGNIVNVQGYEPQILKFLLKFYSEENIIVGDKNIEKYIGKIMYKMSGKVHRYFPDIYLKNENKIIEVKSMFTFKGSLEWVKERILKKHASINNGFNFCFAIYLPNKNEIIWL